MMELQMNMHAHIPTAIIRAAQGYAPHNDAAQKQYLVDRYADVKSDEACSDWDEHRDEGAKLSRGELVDALTESAIEYAGCSNDFGAVYLGDNCALIPWSDDIDADREEYATHGWLDEPCEHDDGWTFDRAEAHFVDGVGAGVLIHVHCRTCGTSGSAVPGPDDIHWPED